MNLVFSKVKYLVKYFNAIINFWLVMKIFKILYYIISMKSLRINIYIDNILFYLITKLQECK